MIGMRVALQVKSRRDGKLYAVKRTQKKFKSKKDRYAVLLHRTCLGVCSLAVPCGIF